MDGPTLRPLDTPYCKAPLMQTEAGWARKSFRYKPVMVFGSANLVSVMAEQISSYKCGTDPVTRRGSDVGVEGGVELRWSKMAE